MYLQNLMKAQQKDAFVHENLSQPNLVYFCQNRRIKPFQRYEEKRDVQFIQPFRSLTINPAQKLMKQF